MTKHCLTQNLIMMLLVQSTLEKMLASKAEYIMLLVLLICRCPHALFRKIFKKSAQAVYTEIIIAKEKTKSVWLRTVIYNTQFPNYKPGIVTICVQGGEACVTIKVFYFQAKV